MSYMTLSHLVIAACINGGLALPPLERQTNLQARADSLLLSCSTSTLLYYNGKGVQAPRWKEGHGNQGGEGQKGPQRSQAPPLGLHVLLVGQPHVCQGGEP